jgi:hypothetical protein
VMAAVVPLKEQDVLEDLAKLREAKDKLSSRLEAAKTHLGDTSLGASEVDEAVTAVAKAAHLDSKILGRDAIDPKAEHEPASRNAALSALIVAAEKDVDALASALQANTNPEVALGWLEVSLDHVWKLVANDPKARKTHAKQVARIAKAFNAIKPTLEQRTRPHRLGAVTGLLEAIRK